MIVFVGKIIATICIVFCMIFYNIHNRIYQCFRYVLSMCSALFLLQAAVLENSLVGMFCMSVLIIMISIMFSIDRIIEEIKDYIDRKVCKNYNDRS